MSAQELKDKEFSFSLRDRLAKYCEDNDLMLSLRHPKNEKMLLDMIVYCSLGDEEQGLENLRETSNFLVTFPASAPRPPGSSRRSFPGAKLT